MGIDNNYCKMHHTVYKTINNLNNKIYIGVHSTENLNDGYLGSGTHFKKAVKRYGAENFTKVILYDFETRKEALKKEREIVNEEFIKDLGNYNLVLGGGGVKKLSKLNRRNYNDIIRNNKMMKKIKEVGFKDYNDFVNSIFDFGNYYSIILLQNGVKLNFIQEYLLKDALKKGFKFDKDKYNTYYKYKYKDEVLKMYYYVAS